ncbi:tetratricopeptide repeat protein [Polynucleobacter paneuropaeus]|nr:tetratricopeptide repeat protein [Polynucleobacter paneuropaeus]MBT8637769.1 tetratricopeptide repeat protein [Polynucleobacter paneuropaeus]
MQNYNYWLTQAINLANLNQLDQALIAINSALQLRPDIPEALSLKASITFEVGNYTAALESFKILSNLDPTNIDHLFNQGVTYVALKDLASAAISFEKASLLDPNCHDAQLNLANCLHEIGEFNSALDIYEQLTKAIPKSPILWLNRGNCLMKLKRFHHAAMSYKNSYDLGGPCCFEIGLAHHSMMSVCDWSDYDLLTGEINHLLFKNKCVAEPFAYQAISNSEEHLKKCAEIFCNEKFPSKTQAISRAVNTTKKRINVGYLCGEFGYQATSILMTNVWELHDKTQFNIIAFDSSWSDKSSYRTRIENAFNKVISIHNKNSEEACSIIKAEEIDILVNLNGYFGRERQDVFALRPAPLQINFLGFPGTIGADYIDYLIADRIVIPEDSRQFYKEKIVYLPNCYQANDPLRTASKNIPTKNELGLPDQQFVFCCFSNNYKITPFTFSLWMDILAIVPNSILWLLQDSLQAEKNLRKAATTAGIDANRLIFAPRAPLSEHLSRHLVADLFLDTLPYTAHTTASDALWMGLPLLTLTGNTFPGRVATSLLSTLNMPDLITKTSQEYVATATNLALNPHVLASVKDKLSKNRLNSPLFNAALFTKNLEKAYRIIFERHQLGLRPENLSV